MVCGELTISADDIIARLQFTGFSASAPTRDWLCNWLRAADTSTLRAFLQFVTASPTLPAASVGAPATQQRAIVIARAGDAGRLPVAHTCGWQLDLPEYASAQAMAQKLQTAVLDRSFGFA